MLGSQIHNISPQFETSNLFLRSNFVNVNSILKVHVCASHDFIFQIPPFPSLCDIFLYLETPLTYLNFYTNFTGLKIAISFDS